MRTTTISEKSIISAFGHLYQMEKEEHSITNTETLSTLKRVLKKLDQIENCITENYLGF